MNASPTKASAPVQEKRHKRSYIINPAFQWKIAGWLMVDVAAVCALMGVILYGVLEQRARAQVLGVGTEAVGAGTLILGFALIFSVLAAATFGMFSIIMTHRLCGPLHVLGRYFNDLAGGRLPKVRSLRKRDEFKEFYGDFRRAVDKMKAAKRIELSALQGILEVTKAAIERDDQTRKGALELASRRIEALRDRVAFSLGESRATEPKQQADEQPSREQQQAALVEQPAC